MGQTVNLLSTTSVVRIHPPPPKPERESVQVFCFFGISIRSHGLWVPGEGTNKQVSCINGRELTRNLSVGLKYHKILVKSRVESQESCENGLTVTSFCRKIMSKLVELHLL